MYGARTLQPIARVLVFGMTNPRGPVNLVSGTEHKIGYFSAGPYDPRGREANLKLDQVVAYIIVHQLQTTGTVREGEFALARVGPRGRRDPSAAAILIRLRQ